MIHLSSLTAAGTFTKTHGIHGELNATLAIEPEYFDEDSCFVCETDGILVPYFIESWRPKGSKGILIQPEDVKSELQAKLFMAKPSILIRSVMPGMNQDWERMPVMTLMGHMPMILSDLRLQMLMPAC